MDEQIKTAFSKVKQDIEFLKKETESIQKSADKKSAEKSPVIVAASGYFDPPHKGHIEYLEKAKKLGDKLIVIVNSDEQTIKKKGYVFMPQSDRILVIQSFRFVDRVMLSLDRDESVIESLRFLKPHIFAKGGDRTRKNIPETPICKELGIKIVDGLGKKVQSSSELVKKLKLSSKSKKY